jgi:hypothetical protein
MGKQEKYAIHCQIKACVSDKGRRPFMEMGVRISLLLKAENRRAAGTAHGHEEIASVGRAAMAASQEPTRAVSNG